MAADFVFAWSWRTGKRFRESEATGLAGATGKKGYTLYCGLSAMPGQAILVGWPTK
jgi:hypothetical protein